MVWLPYQGPCHSKVSLQLRFDTFGGDNAPLLLRLRRLAAVATATRATAEPAAHATAAQPAATHSTSTQPTGRHRGEPDDLPVHRP